MLPAVGMANEMHRKKKRKRMKAEAKKTNK